MKLKRMSFNIYKALLISVFFDAYALFYIKSFPVTLFTVVSVIFIVQHLVKCNIGVVQITLENLLLLMLAIYLLVNYVIYGFKNFTSFMQSMYFLFLAFISYRYETKDSFDNYCGLFQKIMTYMSLYGIYQFIGRIINLPFTDLILNEHMVTGYNWTNTIYIFGQTVYRSNAIFREPSYFGQMLAVSLLLYLPVLFSKEKIEIKNILSMIVQIIALITTFSGTGILIILICFVLYACVMVKKKSFWIRVVPLTMICIFAAIYILTTTSLGTYFLSRANELFVYNKDASSGFVRFRSWILVVEEAWKSNLLLGSGIGTGADYVSKYMEMFFGMTLNGFARVATELGLIGIVLWCGFILSFLKKKKNIVLSNRYAVICCFLVPLIFMQEAFSSNFFWMLIILVNCKIYEVREGKI